MHLAEQISRSLQLPIPLIMGIARKASYAYKQYSIPKRNGGQRIIHHPSQELKALQRWLIHNVINKWPIHDAALAYRHGRGIKTNAKHHAKNQYLLRIDLKDFFPSIHSTDIDFFLSKRPPGTDDWTRDDCDLFKRLVCRNDRLTIGAPTSPSLSNALCYDLDAQLTGLANRHGTIYTRYADDLYFSVDRRDVLGKFPEYISALLAHLECPCNLQINPDKTFHSSKKRRRQVTGLVLTCNGDVSIGRKRKRYIRRQIYRLEKLTPNEANELAGLLAFAISIEPDIYNALVLKYGRKTIEMALRGCILTS